MYSVLDTYLDDVHRFRAFKAGTAETSYYPAIGALLNGVGGQLRPRVFCLHHPSGDAGIPDFGLFEQAQFRRDEAPTWAATVTPERGVVEVKGASHKIDGLVQGKQVGERYLPAYGLVLATNLWQFRLLDAGGTVIETFDLAVDEAGFWALAAGSRPDTLRGLFNDFLQRCLLTRAPLAALVIARPLGRSNPERQDRTPSRPRLPRRPNSVSRSRSGALLHPRR